MISLPQFHKPPPAAGCGSCTACCQIPGVPELGKPYYARCVHVADGCSIYKDRPERCREFRCAWHLNLLGDRVDRRPDQTGVLFQLDPDRGRWYLGIYELVPGAADTERTRYLRDIILTSKKIAHLPMGSPAVCIYPFGADIAVNYGISDRFDYLPNIGPPEMELRGSAYVFTGKCRGMLSPRALVDSSTAGDLPTVAD